MKITNVKSSSDFVKEIERLVTTKNIDFFEAVMHYCEVNNVEVETAAALIKQSTVLKLKIQYEAETLNLLKRTPRLPI